MAQLHVEQDNGTERGVALCSASCGTERSIAQLYVKQDARQNAPAAERVALEHGRAFE